LLLPCSAKEDGYASLFPHVDFGNDLALALYRVGIRASHSPVAVSGYGMIIVNSRECKMLTSYSINGARIEAIKTSGGKPFVLTRAIARGKVTLHERLESVHFVSLSVLNKLDEVKLIAPNGVLLEKAKDIFDKKDIRTISNTLAGRLRGVDKKFIKPHMDKLLKQLVDEPWENLNKKDRAKVFKKLNTRMKALATEKLLPMWEKELKTTVEVVGNKTKKQVTDKFFPRIGTSFDRDEKKALQQIGTQQGWFLRGAQGEVSQRITNKGRKIVEDGLSMGLGRKEIGKRLKDNLPTMWDKYGDNYANVVASNAVVRARSFSQLSTYQDAGIELMEVIAILDERTSDVCRYMDGQVISVNESMNIATEAANIAEPKDIGKVSPFMSVKNTPAGKILTTGTGTEVAEMTRSGKGAVNDRGGFSGFKMGNQLPQQAKIGAPPYHHNCRSLTVPRVESFQIPSSYQVRTASTPIPKIQSFKEMPQRTMVQYTEPSKTKPQVQGTEPALDSYAIPEAFTSEPGKRARDSAKKPNAEYGFRVWREDSQSSIFNDQTKYKTIKKPKTLGQETGYNDPKLFEPIEKQNGLVEVITESEDFLTDSKSLASLVSNKGALNKNSLVQVTDKNNKKVYVRMDMENITDADKNFLDFAGTKLKEGSMTKKDFAALEKRGKKNGWLKTGDKLEDVAKSITDRVSTKSKKINKPKRIKPKVEPASEPEDEIEKPKEKAKPIPPPENNSKAVLSPRSLRKAKLKSSDIAEEGRTSVENRILAAQRTVNNKSPVGFYRTVQTDSEGKTINKSSWGKNTGTASQDFYGKPTVIPDLSAIPLTDKDNIVHLNIGDNIEKPGDLDIMSTSKIKLQSAVEGIINSEKDRNTKKHTQRDYIVHANNGRTVVVRVDTKIINKMDKKELRRASTAIFNQKEESVTDEQLKKFGFNVTDDFSKMYDTFEKDYSKQGLLVGVPIKEQTIKRVAAMREEIDSRVAKIIKEKPKKERYAKREVMRQILQENRATGKPTDNMAKKPTLGSDAKAMDLAYGNMSQASLTALNTKKLPKYKQTKEGVSYYREDKVAVYIDSNRNAQLIGSTWSEGEAGEGKEIKQFEDAFDVLRHEYQHHFDSVGLNGAAAKATRNNNFKAGAIDLVTRHDTDPPNTQVFIPIKTNTRYSGVSYGSTAEYKKLKGKYKSAEEWEKLVEEIESKSTATSGTEFFAMGATAITPNGKMSRKEFLNNASVTAVDAYDDCPDQIAGYLQSLAGAFVPF
jgi:SPP1 gp7 family putative phage head morphogenesis protein